LPVPNAIERVFVLVELNIPVVKVNPANASVPLVNVVVALVFIVSAAANVVLVFGVIVPVPLIVAVNELNVPPLDSVKLFKFNPVLPGLNVVVPKLSVLNQLPLVNVIVLVPLPVSVKFGALSEEPPPIPNANVLVVEASLTKPPVPVYVKLVASVISNTSVAAVVYANIILFEPNCIERVVAVFELNIPVVKSKPFKFNVPLVKVVVPSPYKVNVAANVVVPDVLLIIIAPNVVLVFGVIVPVPSILAVNELNVPPLDSVKLFKFKVIVPGLNVVVPKSSLLK